MKKLIVMALLALGILGGTYATVSAMGVRCPICGLDNCIWTGDVETSPYGLFNVYECVNGHRFLVKQ